MWPKGLFKNQAVTKKNQPGSIMISRTTLHKVQMSTDTTWVSSGTEEESTFDIAESSELDTEESTPNSSIDRHSPSVDRHRTQTAPINLEFPPQSKLEIHEERCKGIMDKILYQLSPDDSDKLLCQEDDY